MERNERYSQAEGWSDPASEGRSRSDAPVYSPTTHSRHPRTPLTPGPSEDRLFTDWSSIGSRSPPVIPPPQNVLIEQTILATGIDGIQETNQTAPQPSQPISQQSHMGAMDYVVQGSLPATPNICQQPQERSNVPSERRMNGMGTNTSDVVIERTRSGPRTSSMEANAQTSIPIVHVLLPSGLGYHVTIPHVNLSISGYEPDSLRTSGIRSPSMRAQEVSAIPQLDGPRSLPMRDHTRGRMGRLASQVEQAPPKEAPTCGELPQLGEENIREEIVIVMVTGDHIKTGDPLTEEGTQVEDLLIEEETLKEVGDPLEEEDTLVEDPLMEEDCLLMDPLDLLEDKDHQSLNDPLDQ